MTEFSRQLIKYHSDFTWIHIVSFQNKAKKNKKKSKSDAKAVQNSSRHDGKEVDEGI